MSTTGQTGPDTVYRGPAPDAPFTGDAPTGVQPGRGQEGEGAWGGGRPAAPARGVGRRRVGSARKRGEDLGEVARLLGLLGDKTRLRILRILTDGERPVNSLTAELRLPQPTVSHHLGWLRRMELVTPRRQGKNVFYSLGASTAGEGGAMTFAAGGTTIAIRPSDPG